MKEKKDIGFVNVIAIKDGVVEESYLFTGDRMEIAMLSHNKLIELCREKFSNFDEYTDDDIESILDDGFAEYGKGSICITWPHVHEAIATNPRKGGVDVGGRPTTPAPVDGRAQGVQASPGGGNARLSF